MGTAYYDPRSVHMRLDRTICIYKGEPRYIEVINGAGPGETPMARAERNIAALNLGVTTRIPPRAAPAHYHMVKAWRLGRELSEFIEVDYREPDFDYRAFPLGYINYNGDTFYLTRIPSRNQKQGLCRSQVEANPVINSNAYFTSTSMADCILGKYPPLSEAIEKVLNMEVDSIAFHRNFALRRRNAGSHKLMYKGRDIGYRRKSGGFKLIESREQNALERVIRDSFTEDELCLR